MPGCLPGTLYSPSPAGQMVKATSPSVLGECEEKHKPPWSIVLKTFSHDSEKKAWPKSPFGLFKNSTVLSLREGLELADTQMPEMFWVCRWVQAQSVQNKSSIKTA